MIIELRTRCKQPGCDRRCFAVKCPLHSGLIPDEDQNP